MEVLAGNQRRDTTVMALGKLEGGWRQKKGKLEGGWRQGWTGNLKEVQVTKVTGNSARP